MGQLISEDCKTRQCAVAVCMRMVAVSQQPGTSHMCLHGLHAQIEVLHLLAACLLHPSQLAFCDTVPSAPSLLCVVANARRCMFWSSAAAVMCAHA